MYSYRATWIVKQGQMKQALKVLSAAVEQDKHLLPEKAVVRVYTPELSPHVLVIDMAFGSVEDHDRFWAAYSDTPHSTAFWQAWFGVTERVVGDERWHLAEWRG